jgi:hypothetical protein
MVDLQDFNKPGWRPKFQSEYSMGELDFQRFNNTLVKIDELSAMVHSCHIPQLELMQQFFSHLVNLYDDFRPLISTENISLEFDEVILRGVELKRIWESSNKSGLPMNQFKIFEFVDLCKVLKTKLYSIKQVIGLGIMVRRNMTTSEKIRNGVHGDRSFRGLPEA